LKWKGAIEELLLLSILILASSVRQAGSLYPPATEWAKTYGIYENSEEAYSLIQTDDGGFAMLGHTRHYFAGWVYTDDFWLVKTDIDGNMEWNRTYGLPTTLYEEVGWSLVQTSEGGYALAGYAGTGGEDMIFDFWLVKTDSLGNMEWNQTYGGADTDFAYSVIQTSDEGYAIAGSTHSYGQGYNDVYLVKTDSDGNMQWNQTYGGAQYDGGKCVIPAGDGGYVIAGQTQSYGAGNYDVWLIKTDSAGNMQWNQTYGGTSADIVYSVVRTSDDGYAIAGKTKSFGAGNNDFWLIKTDESGNMDWNQTYGGTGSEEAWSLIQTDDDGFALTGWTYAFGSSVWLVRTDSAGNMLWNQTYSKGDATEWGFSLVQTADGYAVAGFANYLVGPNDAVVDFWLVKVCVGDVNGDELINLTDLELVSSTYGSFEGGPNYDPDADLYNDGIIDVRDLATVARNVGKF
jgi:hypothetical protein